MQRFDCEVSPGPGADREPRRDRCAQRQDESEANERFGVVRTLHVTSHHFIPSVGRPRTVRFAQLQVRFIGNLTCSPKRRAIRIRADCRFGGPQCSRRPPAVP